MNIAKSLRVAALCAVVLGFTAANAHADFIGLGWVVTNAVSENGSFAELGTAGCHGGVDTCNAANADVTFNATGVNFSSFANAAADTGAINANYTIASWLNSQGDANSIVGHNGVDPNTQILSDGSTSMLFEITGTASFTNGQLFTVVHDDGLEFSVNGVDVINQPGPTSPTTTLGTYTGATGVFAFDLVYGECCGAPAVLQTTLVPNNPVPEPGSVMLLGSVLLGAVFVLRRRKLA